MKETDYFRNKVLVKRPYLKRDWIQNVLSNPEYTERESNGRIRHWGFVEELGKYLRVVVLDDGEKINEI